MRKIFVILIVGFLGSCAFIPEYTWTPPMNIDTLEKMQELIQSVDMVEDTGLGSWNTPETTYTANQGDCNDLAGLMASIMIYNLNYENVKLIGCISRSSGSPHMVVYSDGKYYESYTGRELKKFEQVYMYTNQMTYSRYCKLAQII